MVELAFFIFEPDLARLPAKVALARGTRRGPTWRRRTLRRLRCGRSLPGS